MAFSHIRDDVSSKQERRQISLLTSYGGAQSKIKLAAENASTARWHTQGGNKNA